MKQLDVIIIGAGTAGLGALRVVRKHTQRYAIINDGPWGTMCARVGCMPSKALIEAANAAHRATRFAEFGLRGGARVKVDGAAVLARVRAVRDRFVNETLELTRDLGDHAIDGRARLLDAQHVWVNGKTLPAERIIIATGSRPIVPDAWHGLADRLLTTDSLFEQRQLPRRVAVLGLGAVGAEMAQALARLGCEVHAFERGKRVAGISDPHVRAALLAGWKGELAVHLGHEATLARAGQGVRVTAGKVSVRVDRVLVALGRKRNLDALGLETLGVGLDEHGAPKVDPATMQIEGLPVFLCGDVESDRPVQHEASDEGRIAGLNALGDAAEPHARRVPLRIVFTDPQVASIGQRHEDLATAATSIGVAELEGQGRAVLGLRGPGTLRLYAEKRSQRLLGAELCMPDGEHVAHLVALAIERKCTVDDLLRMPFYHPTIEESLRTALRTAR